MAYKILSLDGGGSWAVIQARVLKDIYGDIPGHELLKQFDMVIANSGGSLVLASLCNNMLISEIISVFEDESKRKQVFSKLNFWEKLNLRNIASLTSVLGPKYSAQRKLEGLRSVLGKYDSLVKSGKASKAIVDTPMNELPGIIGKPSLQIIVVGFDYFKQRACFFRSNPNSLTDKFNNGKYYQITLGHAIHSSSNAPVNYFDSPAEINVNLLNGNDSRKAWYWDGAVSGFNNPVLGAVIEAITNNPGMPLSDYRILSLGTGTGNRAVIPDYQSSTDSRISSIYQKNKDNKLVISSSKSSFLSDIKKMSTSILGDPPDSATFIAYSILDPSLNNDACVVRINPCIKPELNPETLVFEIPKAYANDEAGFIKVMDLDMDAVANDEVSCITQLCSKFITDTEPCLPNQLIRGDESGVHIGYSKYRDAKAKWLSGNAV
ncbi:MAG: patatin-like phospholipase family protein [Mucilaginibacter sp.]|nr:patatin-like phospholipase family protein [Mucilaginibacter sp.]